MKRAGESPLFLHTMLSPYCCLVLYSWSGIVHGAPLTGAVPLVWPQLVPDGTQHGLFGCQVHIILHAEFTA